MYFKILCTPEKLTDSQNYYVVSYMYNKQTESYTNNLYHCMAITASCSHAMV